MIDRIDDLNQCSIIEVYSLDDLYKGLYEDRQKCKAFIIMNNLKIDRTIELIRPESKHNINEVRFLGNPDIKTVWNQNGKYTSGVRIEVAEGVELESIFEVEGMILRVENLVIDGKCRSRLFNINSTNDNLVLEVSNSLLMRGKSKIGGGILSKGGIKMNNSALACNDAFESGGAICISGEKGFNNLNIINTLFIDNKSSISGGAVFAEYDIIVNIKNSIFDSNLSGNGGAIGMTSGKIKIESCYFDENDASKLAGAIYIKKSSESRIIDTEFRDNKSFYYGPIMLGFDGANIEIDKCFFYDNITYGNVSGSETLI